MSKFLIYLSLGLALCTGMQQWRIHRSDRALTVAQQNISQLTLNRDQLAQSLSASEASNRSLKDALQRRERLLLQRQQWLASQQKQFAELTDKLKGLRKTDEKTKQWSHARVPDGVIRLLGASRSASGRANRVRTNEASG
ncbi:hypothetical protein [Celerinatantimonas sp. YJH-8]|uniref:hypothetical protein n=1 Tax=Celerinatantimonas sp. YJH-8 TaxID=3228714 RepID=UPI0038BEEEBF